MAKKANLTKDKVDELHRAVTKCLVKGLHPFPLWNLHGSAPLLPLLSLPSWRQTAAFSSEVKRLRHPFTPETEITNVKMVVLTVGKIILSSKCIYIIDG